MEVRRLRATTYEQRSVLYEDVEQLVSPGFLTCRVRVGSSHITLRTLGAGDAVVLNARVPRAIAQGDLEGWRWTIAMSAWMIDGYLLREGDDERMADALAACPEGVVANLFDVFLHNLVGRLDQARHAAYVYVYEAASRDLWRTHGARPWEVGMVPGARGAAGNPIQKWWTAFNEVEDIREDYARHWRGYKLITSATSPKGIKRINDNDERTEQNEEQRRSDALNRYYWYRAGVIAQDDYVKGLNQSIGGRHKLRLKSVDELADEHRRWVQGIEDDHDRIVREFKRREKARVDAWHQGMMQARAAAVEEHLDFQGPDMRNPMTADTLGPAVRTASWVPDSLHHPRHGGPSRS